MALTMRLAAGAVGLAVVLSLSGCGDAPKQASKEDIEGMKKSTEEGTKMLQKRQEEAAKKAAEGKSDGEKKDDKKDK